MLRGDRENLVFLIHDGHDGPSFVAILRFDKKYAKLLDVSTRLSTFFFCSAKMSPISSRWRSNLFAVIEIAYRINRSLAFVRYRKGGRRAPRAAPCFDRRLPLCGFQNRAASIIMACGSSLRCCFLLPFLILLIIESLKSRMW